MGKEHRSRWLFCIKCKKNFIGQNKTVRSICGDCTIPFFNKKSLKVMNGPIS